MCRKLRLRLRPGFTGPEAPLRLARAASFGSSVQKSTRFQRVMGIEISPALTRQWDRLLFT